MNNLVEILKITIPSLIVFFTAYFFLVKYMKNENEKRKHEVKSASQKETLLLRLQAYERMILLLERISPSNLLMRLNKNNMSAADFHIQALTTIRAEYEHNLAQQLYISSEAWQQINIVKEELIKGINLAKEKIKDEDNAYALVKVIMIDSAKLNQLVSAAISFLKKEAHQLF